MSTTKEASEEDALYVLTAALLTPAQFPSALGDDFTLACATLGLTPDERGYGLVLGQDGVGARWTVVVDDVSLVAVAIAAWDCGMEHELSPPEQTVIAALPGWPLALTVTAPGLPAPHDPVGGDDPLTPPDTTVWGSAQRRLGADEIAAQWFTWREAFDTPVAADGPDPRPRAEAEAGETRPEPEVEVEGAGGSATGSPSGEAGAPGPAPAGHDVAPAGAIGAGAARADTNDAGTDVRDPTEAHSHAGAAPAEAVAGTGSQTGGQRPGAPVAHTTDAGALPGLSHPGVHHVLRALHGYVEQAPPPGRIRSSFAPEGARTLRADGPGWSFVARTDDMAFVLLDDEPGKVLPVGRGAELPALLTALDAIAVRPV